MSSIISQAKTGQVIEFKIKEVTSVGKIYDISDEFIKITHPEYGMLQPELAFYFEVDLSNKTLLSDVYNFNDDNIEFVRLYSPHIFMDSPTELKLNKKQMFKLLLSLKENIYQKFGSDLSFIYDVLQDENGNVSKLEVVKIYKDITGFGLGEAKKLVDAFYEELNTSKAKNIFTIKF